MHETWKFHGNVVEICLCAALLSSVHLTLSALSNACNMIDRVMWYVGYLLFIPTHRLLPCDVLLPIIVCGFGA